MDVIIELLRNEIARLKADRSDLVVKRSELIASFDIRIADIDQRLTAAERMLAAYGGVTFEPGANEGASSAEGIKLTWTAVEATDIPTSLKGHRLRPNSKKAKIIRASKAFLQLKGVASRFQIVQFLQILKIMADEKNPEAYLSVILSSASEIFVTNGMQWHLRCIGNSDKSSHRQICDHSGADY